MRICLLLVFAMCCSITNHACSQESNGSLAQQIQILELKLQLAEEQLKQSQEECDALRKENARLKNEEDGGGVAVEDQFSPGVVWAGVSKATGADKSIRWAISISKRDGEKFEGGVATESPSGDKIEFPVTGRAPRSGNGLVILESPAIGRAQIFMRGTIRNGAIALAFSGTNPLGKKFFGSATLSPKK